MSTYIIADIGANHDGQRARMLEAIDEAKHGGCDAAKFQWVSDPVKMAKRRGRAYADGYAEVYAKYLAWPSEWHEELAAHCRERGIDYLCTVFLPEDVATVAPHVARFKIASFEAGDIALIEAHCGRDKQLIVSAGMMSINEAWELGDVLVDVMRDHAVLHCLSSYPAPAEQLCLHVLRRDSLGERPYHGFSDHSDPELTWTGALAVAAGAEIVEAHLRLDRTDPANPDYPHAMTPRQFADYVRHIRFAETCLGDGEKRQQPCEAAMARYRVGRDISPAPDAHIGAVGGE